MDWFYDFKLHLIANGMRELMTFKLINLARQQRTTVDYSS
ncbi:transposase DDE domain protein [Piscirickettsia salmonis LF-89 = ATCC VR-1361]|nr:transposase DDE domain protein [Piscirickettsia salmonis LF-89 = ATCC VR-1361]